MTAVVGAMLGGMRIDGHAADRIGRGGVIVVVMLAHDPMLPPCIKYP
jgi:hypothetical protein